MGVMIFVFVVLAARVFSDLQRGEQVDNAPNFVYRWFYQ